MSVTTSGLWYNRAASRINWLLWPVRSEAATAASNLPQGKISLMATFDDLDTSVGEEAPTVGDTLSWPDRIKNYRRVIRRAAYVSYEDGWAHGMWFLGNSWAVKSGYYGGYPQGYLKRLRALFPDKRRVLHLFSGRVNTAESPGDTCDVNAALEPTSSPTPTTSPVCQ